MNLTGGAIFPEAMIKRERSRFNKRINISCHTRQLIQEI